MSIETQLVALLKPLCPRVRPLRGEEGMPTPYVVYQVIGGESINALDNSLPGQRRVLMQVAVWSKTLGESQALGNAIEAAMRSTTHFTAQPSGEAIPMDEPHTGLYGQIQRFFILGNR